jgi:hypothetical protein
LLNGCNIRGLGLLNTTIDSNVMCSGVVILVGHSLGGIISQIYTENGSVNGSVPWLAYIVLITFDIMLIIHF